MKEDFGLDLTKPEDTARIGMIRAHKSGEPFCDYAFIPNEKDEPAEPDALSLENLTEMV